MELEPESAIRYPISMSGKRGVVAGVRREWGVRCGMKVEAVLLFLFHPLLASP